MLAGLTCAFAGLCYAEFASLIPSPAAPILTPIDPGRDLRLDHRLGPHPGVFAGRDDGRDRLVGLRRQLPQEPRRRFPGRAGRRALFLQSADRRLDENGRPDQPAAALVIALITYVLVRGIKESATVNSIIVFLKISIILIFIGAGLFFIKPALWKPFIPPNQGQFGFFGLSGILRGAG